MTTDWLIACIGGWAWGCVLVIWCMSRVPWRDDGESRP
jgi:hypothetical protein